MAQVKFKRIKGNNLPTYQTTDNGTILFLEGSKEIYMGDGSWIKYGDGDNNFLDVRYANNKLLKTYDGTTWEDVIDFGRELLLPAANVTFNNSGSDTELKSTDVQSAIKELEDNIATGGAGSVVTLEKQGTPETGYAATYVIKQGTTAVGGGVNGKINIPLDQFLKNVAYVSEAPVTPEGNSGSVVFPALRFEWQLDTDDQTAGDQVVTYVSIAELGATGTLTFDNTNATWTSTNGLLTTQAFKAEIDKMDGSIASSNGTNVNVTVTQTNGKVTAVSVSDSSINATDLSTAISNLGSASATTGSVVTGVSVNNGALEVSERALSAVAFSGSANDVAYTNASLSGVNDVDGALDAIVDKIDDAAAASKTTLSTVAASTETVADGTSFIKVVETSPAASDGHINYEVSTKGIKDYIKTQIEALDTPTGGVTSTGGSKVTVTAVETDGVISGLTVAENDIASATTLSNEIESRKANETTILTVNATATADETQYIKVAETKTGDQYSYEIKTTGITTALDNVADLAKTYADDIRVNNLPQDDHQNITVAGGNINATGYTTTGISGDVAASDNLNTAIAKVEVKANNALNALTWIDA